MGWSEVILDKKFLLLRAFAASPSSPEVWEGGKRAGIPGKLWLGGNIFLKCGRIFMAVMRWKLRDAPEINGWS